MDSTTDVMMKKRDSYFRGKKENHVVEGREPKLADEARGPREIDTQS